MKTKALFICLCTGYIAASFGQSPLGLTFPYGIPIQPNSGMSLTMGGAACAVANDHNVMLRNPANLGVVDKTVLSALYSFDINRVVESSKAANFFSSTPLQISIGIPFGIAGTLALSFDQRSERSALFRDGVTVPYYGSSVTDSLGLVAKGGLVGWQAGWGISIKKYFQIGVSYERYYLSLEQTRLSSTSFNSVTTTSRDSTKVEGSGNGVRGGILVPVGNLKIGLAGEYNFVIDAKSVKAVYANQSYVPTENSLVVEKLSLRFPPSLSFGLSYDFSPEWLVASDLTLQFWSMSKFSGILVQPGANTATGISLGAQFIPAPNLLTPKYWETMRYRAGLRFTQLPGKDSYEYMLCLGTGLPLGNGMGLVDIGIEAGRRQSGLFKNYSEDVLRIGVGFNGGHKWAKTSKGNY
jgi:hypothetical protein